MLEYWKIDLDLPFRPCGENYGDLGECLLSRPLKIHPYIQVP